MSHTLKIWFMNRDDLTQRPDISPKLGDRPRVMATPRVANAANTSRVHPDMDNLEYELRQLIAEACNHPSGSWERQDKLDDVYRLVTKSRKLWKESTPYYNDALQQMWEYCCQHPEEYDPTVKGVITWLDDELKKRLRRFKDADRRRRSIPMTNLLTQEGQTTDLVENQPADPDMEPVLEIWEATLNWVRTDPDGVLRSTYFRGRTDINCQALFLRRFPAETPWPTIAAEFNLTPSEALDLPKFYSRRCKPVLREFGLLQGYIEKQDTPRTRKLS
jgi:hypothetical protein